MADADLSPAAGAAARAAVELDAGDLVGHGVTFCPNPRMPLWSGHPKVFLDVAKTGEARCPYCGTVYRLAGGAAHGGH